MIQELHGGSKGKRLDRARLQFRPSKAERGESQALRQRTNRRGVFQEIKTSSITKNARPRANERARSGGEVESPQETKSSGRNI